MAAAVAAIGCGGPTIPPIPPGDSQGPSPSAEARIDDSAARLDRLLDPASRDLLTVIEPEENIEATLTIANSAEIADLARARGLESRILAADTVNVSGPVATVLEFARAAGPTELNIQADQRVDRWIPNVRPTVQLPTPGSPYRTAALVVDGSRLGMTAEQRVGLLRTLAAAIVTIDGAPYDRIEVNGACSGRPPSCDLSAEGFMTTAGGVSDSYGIISDATANGIPRLDSMIAGGVPRPIAREAEWIARHDPAGAAAIPAYRVCCYAAWDPARPGRIAITYSRQCLAGAAPGGILVAETGDCTDTLTIVVDLGTATVVSIVRQHGP